ncbi:hypothetical protein ABT58_00320 [Photobacterium aphoticum]|uniref:Uncharacterized protein n=1 Tax=Photobacterium aphoticum TaxID=754436 RepID=A0A0J1JLK4_9GAMM|nr:hypothetical protein ABT58_00320 [Photobacterium aphoticum]
MNLSVEGEEKPKIITLTINKGHTSNAEIFVVDLCHDQIKLLCQKKMGDMQINYRFNSNL